MIRILIDLAAVLCFVILTGAAIVQTLALVKLVRADTKRWRAEAEAHEQRATDRERFLEDMRRRHGQEAFRS